MFSMALEGLRRRFGFIGVFFGGLQETFGGLLGLCSLFLIRNKEESRQYFVRKSASEN